jgi:heme/copper-type cytochrome/quinol oxidase subunit 3/mono/diheme cytochrome c family protein
MTPAVLKRLIRRSGHPAPRGHDRPQSALSASLPPSAAETTPPISAQLRELTARLGLGRGELAGIVILDALLFLSLPLIYLWIRGGNADAFRWGWHFLNRSLGAATTGLLLVGAVAMLLALRWARQGRQRPLIATLSLALLAGLTILGLHIADFDTKRYYGLLPGEWFRPSQRYVARKFGVRLLAGRAGPPAPAVATAAPPPRMVDAERGRKLFLSTCASCHGAAGEGVPGSGKELRGSQFITTRDDAALLAFVKQGRQPWDPLNTTRLAMPPRGGNPLLSDADLADIIAFVRTLQTQDHPTTAASTDRQSPAASNPPAGGEANRTAPAAPQPPTPPALLITHRSILPAPGEAAPGLSARFLSEQARPRWRPPEGAAAFFGAYYFVTGLHGIHLVAAVLLSAVLLVEALRGSVRPARCGSVVLGSIVWCWSAALWLLTYPVVFMAG